MRFLFLGPIALVAARFLPEHPGISERQLLDAICQVESRGREDCADGDGGRSIGPFQISRSYWRDAVEFEPSLGGSFDDCRKRDYAERVVRTYMRRYVPGAWERLDAPVISRTHNGGPIGAQKPATVSYWRKVQRALLAPSAGRAAGPR